MRAVLLCVLLGLASSARASWTRVESANVVVYGEASERELRQRVRKLERFHALLDYMIPGDAAVVRPRYTLYLVEDTASFHRALPSTSAYVVAKYATLADGSYAIALTRNKDSELDDDALMEQFAMHFARERTTAPLPFWAALGFSQYVSTADVEGKHVALGKASHRREREVELTWLSLERVLTAAPLRLKDDERAPYRGQSWLLVHYLLQDRDRWFAAQRLFAALRAGLPAEQAVQQTLGMPLGTLRQALEGYTRRDMSYRLFDLTLPEPLITATSLPASADALLLDGIGLDFGRMEQTAIVRLRGGPARFPGDTLALELAARAEVAAGDGRRALAFITPLLVDGASPNHNYIAAMAHLAVAEASTSASEREDAFVAAGNLFARVIKADGRSYAALYRYYKVRSRDAQLPDVRLQDVLLRAYELSPRTPDIAIDTGVMLLRVGRLEEARTVFAFLAEDPLARGTNARAERLLALLGGLLAGLPPGQPPSKATIDAVVATADSGVAPAGQIDVTSPNPSGDTDASELEQRGP